MRDKFKKLLPKRILALAAALAMVVTMLPGMGMTAEAVGKEVHTAEVCSSSFMYFESYWCCNLGTRFEVGHVLGAGMYLSDDSRFSVGAVTLDGASMNRGSGNKLQKDALITALDNSAKTMTLVSVDGIASWPTALSEHTDCSHTLTDHFYYSGMPAGNYAVGRYFSWNSYVNHYSGSSSVELNNLPQGATDGWYYYDSHEGKYVPCQPVTKYDVWVGDVQVTEDNKDDVLGATDGADATVKYTPATDSAPATLELNGATIETSSGKYDKFGIQSEEDLNIVLKGNNTIGKASDWGHTNPQPDDYAVLTGIYARTNALKFSGDGKLTIYDYVAGIDAKNVSFGTAASKFNGNVIIRDYGGRNDECGIHARGEWDNNIYQDVDGDISINGGTFDIISKKSNGIETEAGNVTINDAKVDIVAGDGTSNDEINGILGVNVYINNSVVSSKAHSGSGYTATGISTGDSGKDNEIVISGSKSVVTAEGIGEEDPEKHYKDGYGIGAGESSFVPVITITDAKIQAKGTTAAIMAATKDKYPLTIGSAANPMSIKNAKIIIDKAGTVGDAVTEGSGKLEIGYDYDSKGTHLYHTLLVAADGTGYVEIGSKSGGNTPVIPIIPPSNNGTINGTIAGGEAGRENINVNVSGGNATISDIPSSVINNAANTQPNSKEIVIDVSDAGYADVSKVTLTKTTAETIAKVLESSANNKETLTIKSDTATVSIDATALKSIANQAKGNDIQLVVDNKSQGALNASQQGQLNGKVVEKTFEAYFVSGGSRISNFNGGTVTVGKVDFKVPAGKNPKNFHVEYLPTSGAAVRHKTWFADGVLYFDTTHFSDYAIVYDETSANYTYNPIYRLYDPNRGEHVYTYNVAERNHLVGLGWVDETKADGSNSFFGSDIKTEVCNKPVYRVYNPNNGGNHHYTLNKAEAKNLVNQGWVFDFEGKPVFYVSTDKNMGVIFYRSYNPNSPSGEHQWARKGEHQALLKKGWEDEGECFVSVE